MGFKATRLRCEHREDIPLVATGSPRLGWVLEADGRDRRQSAYRVLVATDAKLLDAERGNLWDSGKVCSSQSVDIPYAGRPLPPGAEIAWTVQVYDENGVASAWAQPARLRTGLESWSASWIRHDRAESYGVNIDPARFEEMEGDPGFDLEGLWHAMDPAPHLRRSFNVDAPVRRATLYATARGLLDLELNGRRVGDSTLDPGWSDYPKRMLYAAHDVTSLLHEGENALGAVLGDGWYAGFLGCNQKQGGALYGWETELLCELHIELADGNRVVIGSDERWRSTTDAPIRHADLLHGECHDARLNIDGWSEQGFDDSGWTAVLTRPLDGGLITPAKSQPIRVVEELRPVAVTESRPGVHLFDLGQNIVGRARLVTEGTKGTRIQLRFGEVLDEHGSLYRENLLSAKQTDTFVLRGEGVETFEPRFTSHGFRYVEVSGLAQAPHEGTITGCVAHTDAPLTSAFRCSEELVNRLYHCVVWTQRDNLLSVSTDCPQRDERLGWLGDAQFFMPTSTLNMDLGAFLSKWGDDITDGQSAEGAYPDVAPRISWLNDGAPGWGDAGITVPWMLYTRYGDLGALARHWPHMERFMDYLALDNPDHVRRRHRNADYGDWLSVEEGVSKELLATAWWSRAAKLMARIAMALERPERARYYDALAARIDAAFNEAYVGEDGAIEGDTQTGYLLALAFDLLPGQARSGAARRLVANIEAAGWHPRTGIVGTGLLCSVLAANGHPEVAHRLLLQDTFPSWGHFVRHGATTIWENWDGWTEERGFHTPLQNSFCHYALGAFGHWLIEGIAGIRCADEAIAYEHVVIRPVPGEMNAARGSYRSVRGEIVSDWKREAGRFQLAVTIPANVTATVFIPAVGETLMEGKGKADDADGVRSVSREQDAWRVEIGSGCYEFASC